MRFSLSLVAVALSVAPSALAFFPNTRGPACTTVGALCAPFADGSGGTISTAYCAPDLVCGDEGATCTDDTSCYNYCGSGICGGAGAACTSTLPANDPTNPDDAFTCFTPAVTCNVATSTCVTAASGAARRHRARAATNAAF